MKINYKKSLGLFLFLQLSFLCAGYCGVLKSIIYDFDGLDINQTDLPEGDYKVNDLTYKISANPLQQSEMLGDRVLQLNLNWNNGNGVFGRGISRFVEMDPATDIVNFYFYNPTINNQNAIIDVVIFDDDDKSNSYSSSSDDSWIKTVTLSGSSGWQLISIPLNNFSDSNTGGNGVFDIAFTNEKGMLLGVEFRLRKPFSSASNPTFYIDMLCFTDGTLPTGHTIFDLPEKNSSDYCLLGAFKQQKQGEEHLTPGEIEGLFPSPLTNKLKYINWFVQFGMDGQPKATKIPGDEVKILLDKGYTPIITWEPMFQGYSRLDPVQPRLSNIINGDYDTYIKSFADKIKSYNDTVIIRFMHEFEGDWYSWSLTHNNQDPTRYIAAFRHVVDLFRSRGVNNVKWMWCLNSDYFPYRAYNWAVKAYPGIDYVDIVATDIYNNHYPEDLPWWRSFRWQTTESYYYLTKYFPEKPLYMAEFSCRERKSIENQNSESKAKWFIEADKQMQSNFNKIRSMVFFSAQHENDWRINSSQSSLDAVTTEIWEDNYYLNGTIPPTQSNTEIISAGASWKYLDNGTDQGTIWRSNSFDDSTWKTGNAELGYGDGGEATVVSYGTSSTNKFITTYFRKTFNVNDSTTITALDLNILRDDGAVVYINGTEVFRTNMPSGTISYTTLAPAYIDGSGESQYILKALSPSVLITGVNTIAIEIHQQSKSSSDISFNLKLTATNGSPSACNATSGLNATSITSSSASLNWNTVSGATNYDIQYRQAGTAIWNTTNSTINSKAISGLAASTTYEFQVKTNCSGSSSIYSNPFSFTTSAASTTTQLIPAGSSWKYLDNGSNQGTAWRTTAYSDAAWKTGNAELGYGDGGESTVVSYGSSSTNKYITTYFRKTFTVTDKSTISGLELSLIRDDGAVVYINGTEVYRSNMPAGTIAYNTKATTYIDGANESIYVISNISSSSLINGTNLIAVEIHQNSISSSDISFNLKLKTLSGARITDAPEGENISPNSSKSQEIHLYPNPSTGLFTYEFCRDNYEEETLEIQVFNSLGQSVFSNNVRQINGCIRQMIELDKNLPNGVYFLNAKSKMKEESIRLFLTR